MKKTIFLILFLLAVTSITKAQTYSDFTLPDLESNDVVLSKLIEKGPVMLSFWATWCSPCKEEMKKMHDVYLKYKDKGFTYIAINQDNQKSISKVKGFIESQGYKYIVLLDTDKRVFEAYGGKDEIPYSILINKNKEVVSVHVGFKSGDEDKIENEIKLLLN